MNRTPFAATIASALALAMVNGPVEAQKLYRYVDDNGRVTYSERPPAEAAGKAMDRLSRQGVVVERVQAAPSAEDRAAVEAEKKKRAEDEAARRLDERRTQAIMSAYSSEAEIRDNRENTLKPVREAIAQVENSIAKLEQRLAVLTKGAGAERGKGGEGTFRREIHSAEAEHAALLRLLEGKKKEEQSIVARFDEDLRRFVAGSKERESRTTKRAPLPGAAPMTADTGRR